jgi:hypothetical protein
LEATLTEHYELWDQELAAISNQELKQQGRERRAEVTKAFGDIKEAFNQVSMAFAPYLKNLQDLQRYLAADLSAAGVKGAGGMIGGLKLESVGVQRHIQTAASKIKDLQTSMGRTQL